uniref:mRNA (guanine-N(7))-methyltransferase n=1 Tax=viral metagenome TaxID=1070528 RepID=A0A6C0CRL6_9ZZZZ
MSEEKPQQTLDNLTKLYLENVFRNARDGVAEMEVRFGTGRGMKRITKIQQDNIIKKLLSVGFVLQNSEYHLRINSEYTDSKTGVTRISRIRAEINGLGDISEYCKSNDIQELYDKRHVKFIQKMPMKIEESDVRSYDVADYNFRAALSVEKDLTNTRATQAMVGSWKDNKKIFRFIHRHKFYHRELPIEADISIVKESARDGRYMKPTYTFDEARVVTAPESYEVEFEVNNNRVGPGTSYSSEAALVPVMRKMIRYILSGMQESNYPISYIKQNGVLNNYMQLLWKDEYREGARVYPKNFVGPSSYTLQVQNIAPINDDSVIPNIRNEYTVTDKADGERKMMFIDSTGKIYLLTTNMDVQFTGAKTTNEDLFDTLIDGEHITHDKNGTFINLYAAFDLYYLKKVDKRTLGFMPSAGDNENNFRFPLLTKVINGMKATSVVKGNPSPMRFEFKTFYASNERQSIFQACNYLLNRVNSGVFEYETDGLIFTPSKMGVGGNTIGETTYKPIKTTWAHSFKWKPPEYNTIDFLVTIQKSSDGQEEIKSVFEAGTDVSSTSQITQYKTAILRVGFDEAKHGYVNPCKNVIDDDVPDASNPDDDEGYRPMQFFPTNPTDEKGGICNLILEDIGGGDKVIFSEEKEVVEDNMIVEFRYDATRDEGWRWIPLRVRYDKTADFRSGGKNYGNAYHVANSNWHTIHNPISVEMLTTGEDIPDELGDDDVYYNRVTNSNSTRALRDFHNLYVKRKLITSVAVRGNTLIDLAVGKAGDMSKWIDAKLRFVFGVDIARDNIENRLDGACARYLNYRKKFKRMPTALFVSGNSSVNIRNGDGVFTDKDKMITKAVFGKGAKNEAELGKGVYKQYGIGSSGFDICSIQFAIHYMFENLQTLNNFLRNVSETTKVGGYFIGTSYDGSKVFSMLKAQSQNESKQIMQDEKKIWEVTKRYDRSEFKPDASSLGYSIDVYQESINKTFREYLVNFEYLDRLMENYGFTQITRDEAKDLGLPAGRGSFRELYGNMKEEIKRNRRAKNEYGTAVDMTIGEETISFLNNYFVYKKTHDVDAKQIANKLMGNTQIEQEIVADETAEAVEALQEIVKAQKKKPKKLKKKLKLKQNPKKK